MSAARSFVKWTGGKGRMIEQIVPYLPKSHGRYFEPFVGGGALFWHLKPKRAVLSDVNQELVHAYRVVRDHLESLAILLRMYVYEKDFYYSVRDMNPESLSPVERAARMIYLNKCGFNGLYRVNRSGVFNVPFGRYVNPMICDASNLRACSEALQGVDIRGMDWDTVTRPRSWEATPQAGDLVYLDPPYVPEPGKDSFVGYASGGFGDEQQAQLALRFSELADRGAYVLASNSDTPRVRELYRGFRMIELKRGNCMSSKASDRTKKVPELLILGWERT